jgi:F-type H+-transporting ATPase subunit b
VDILYKLGINYTYFIQLGVFIILFLLLRAIYFKPFQKLFEARHKKTVEDKKAAEGLLAQAEARFKEYEEKLKVARAKANQEYNDIVNDGKKREAELFAKAREEVKNLNQEAAAEATKTREKIRRDLETDVEKVSAMIAEKLLGSVNQRRP